MDLHRSRSCATLMQSLYDIFVHSLMLSVHIVLGLPRPFLPLSFLPSAIVVPHLLLLYVQNIDTSFAISGCIIVYMLCIVYELSLRYFPAVPFISAVFLRGFIVNEVRTQQYTIAVLTCYGLCHYCLPRRPYLSSRQRPHIALSTPRLHRYILGTRLGKNLKQQRATWNWILDLFTFTAAKFSSQ